MSTGSTTSKTRGSARRCASILLILILGTFLLGLSTPTAHAAPPEVTASENPVVIPDGQTMKGITLTWSLVPITPLAMLTVTESGTPTPVLEQQVSWPPGTGTVPLTVTYGKSYTAQLKTAFTGLPLGAPLTITTERPPKRADDLGCRLQCITNVGVEPHGGWAQFTVATSQKAFLRVEASTTQPNPDGAWSNPGAVTAATATIGETQNWTPKLADLDSNTTYYYVVRAKAGGHEQFKTGSFKTLTRRVDVTFAEILMFDDSDGAGAGDCDCFFWFNAGNEPPKPYGDLWSQKSIASGTTVHPNIALTIPNTPGEIRIRALGYDDDTDFGEWCSHNGGHPEYTGASNWEISGNHEECMEWAGGQADVFIPSEGPDTPPSTVSAFTIYVSGELLYEVRGTYKVTYAP